VTTGSEAGAQYRHFDAMPLCLGVLRAGRLVYVNAAMLELLGPRAEELIGRPLPELVNLTSGGALLEDRHARRMRGEVVPSVYETSLTTPSGPRRVEVSVTVSGEDSLVVVRDVSARAHYRTLLQLLAELGAGLPGLRSEEEVISRVFGGLAELGFTFAWLVPEGRQARLERLHIPLELSPVTETRSWAEGVLGAWSPLLERTWSEGSAYEPELALEVSRFALSEITEGVQARLRQARLHVVGVRIDAGGMRRAVLAVAASWIRQEELPPLRLFGAQVSAALEAALTISQLSAQNTALAALNRLAAKAASAREPGDLFDPGAKEIARLLGCDALGLLLHAEATEELELVYSHGLDPLIAERYGRLPLRGSLSAQAIEQGTTLVMSVENCSDSARENMLRLGYQTVAVVPMRVRLRTMGTLVVAFHQRRTLTPLERETLQAMGTHFAAATESHRLLAEVRRRADDLALIHEVSHNIVATLEMELLMQIGVEGLARIARSSDAFLLLPDAQGQRLVIRASVHHRHERIGYSVPIHQPDSSLSARAMHSRQPVVVEDATRQPGIHQDLRRQLGITAALVIPLVVRERAIGVAVISESKGARRYSPSEVERASAISNQLALALEQARLVEDLKASYAELARTQEQLVQRERLAALGELSAVMAHEVRNPLGVIFNSVVAIRRLIGPANPALPLVEIVGEEADRLNRIVDDLLHLARPLSPSPLPVPLRPLLEEAVRGALASASGSVNVEWALEPEVPSVLADERMMRQAFLNIALNAVQAMPQGGTLRVGMRRAQGPKPEVRVEFTDTGPGMTPEVRARIFEPFFTTKAQGTGLGLALVKRILESHSGRLTLESQPGKGTTFYLFLPCEPEATPPAARASTAQAGT
jgi:PAS domain S-box-containing protein